MAGPHDAAIDARNKTLVDRLVRESGEMIDEIERLAAVNRELCEVLEAIVMKLMPAAQTNRLNADFRPLYEKARADLESARQEEGQ